MPITVQSYEEEFTIHNPVSKIREKESGKAILRAGGAKHGDAGRGRIGAERRTEREQRGQGADEAGGRERRGASVRRPGIACGQRKKILKATGGGGQSAAKNITTLGRDKITAVGGPQNMRLSAARNRSSRRQKNRGSRRPEIEARGRAIRSRTGKADPPLRGNHAFSGEAYVRIVSVSARMIVPLT